MLPQKLTSPLSFRQLAVQVRRKEDGSWPAPGKLVLLLLLLAFLDQLIAIIYIPGTW